MHAGDFTNVGSLQNIVDFSAWLGKQTDFKHKIVIAGNHDLSFDPGSWPTNAKRFGHKLKDGGTFTSEQARAALTNCTYLEDSGVSDARHTVHECVQLC